MNKKLYKKIIKYLMKVKFKIKEKMISMKEEIKIEKQEEIKFLIFNNLGIKRREKIEMKINEIKNLTIYYYDHENNKIYINNFKYFKISKKFYFLYFYLNLDQFQLLKLFLVFDENLNFNKSFIENNEQKNNNYFKENKKEKNKIKINDKEILIKFNEYEIKQTFLNYENILKKMFSSGSYVFRIDIGLYRYIIKKFNLFKVYCIEFMEY
jgi:hypothetical protein